MTTSAPLRSIHIAFLATLLLLTAPWPAAAQGIIRFEDGAESYTFQVAGDRWATVTGLELEYRARYGSLLGEPWVISNFRYWFWGQRGESNMPLVTLHRLRGSQESSGDLSIGSNAEYLGSIRLWVDDAVSVRRTNAGAFEISYPFERFVSLVRLNEADFVASFDGVLFVGPFTGAHGRANEWGWNVPDSPSWDQLLVSRRDPVSAATGERNVFYEPAAQAQSLTREWRERCTPFCEGDIIGLDALRMNILPVITDIAGHSPEFSAAFFNSPRTAQVASLVGAVDLEQDPDRRAQRERIAAMAVDAFGDEVDPQLAALWNSPERGQAGGREVHEAAEVALCEVETQGRASPETVSGLADALDRPDVHPALRERGRAALTRLGRGGLGTGDVQVTLTWDNSADLDLYVLEPSGATISYGNRTSASGGQLDVDDTDGFGPENVFWPTGQAPVGTYQVQVNLFRGSPTPFRVRVLNGGEVTEHSGYASGQVGVVDFTFQGARAETASVCTRLTS